MADRPDHLLILDLPFRRPARLRPESLKALDGHAFIPHSSVAEMAAVSDVVGLCLREDSGNVQVVTDEGCWRRSAGAAVRFGFQLRAAGHRPVDHR